MKFKIIPLDWAKNNEPCDAYMTCEYQIKGHAIKVVNGFTDYSMFNTPFSGRAVIQQIPNFSVIVALDRFLLSQTDKTVKEIK